MQPVSSFSASCGLHAAVFIGLPSSLLFLSFGTCLLHIPQLFDMACLLYLVAAKLLSASSLVTVQLFETSISPDTSGHGCVIGQSSLECAKLK